MKTIKDYMSKESMSVSPQTSVKEVIEFLVKHAISSLPVVNDNHEVIGIVTQGDLLYRAHLSHMKNLLEKESAYIDPKPLIYKYRKMGGATVEQVMTKSPLVVSYDQPIEAAVDLMIEKKINSLPVVLGKKLKGMLYRIDVMKYLMHEEHELEKHVLTDHEISTIVSQILEKGMDFEIRNLQVSSEKGKVFVLGEVDSQKNLDEIKDLIRSIRGVKDVELRLLPTRLLS